MVARITWRGAVILNRAVPAVGCCKKLLCTQRAELLQIALKNHIKIAEKNRTLVRVAIHGVFGHSVNRNIMILTRIAQGGRCSNKPVVALFAGI